MKYRIEIVSLARADLVEIYQHIAWHDSPQKADHVIDELLNQIESLATMPQRGVHPRELADLGLREFREVHFKPYRIVHRVDKKNVYVVLVADRRRDMGALLRRRLVDPS